MNHQIQGIDCSFLVVQSVINSIERWQQKPNYLLRLSSDADSSLKMESGKIPWDEINKDVFQEIHQDIGSTECRRIWKYLAYGDIYSKETNEFAESDEVI